ncbi:superinfection immunity protein [Anaerotignum lactatifermentans]|uniref:Superinfection immunity protein n=1 Tax=Anaerotignum lactatifermentans TaxID=160404 RepID=A0A1Y3U813_9FIRM|nr:superinfection immunity protein [Anaerotignum lactatifermentans]OUN44883.1 hypothetical protein B5G26_04390 [Anaerotignum lactatifermentans]
MGDFFGGLLGILFVLVLIAGGAAIYFAPTLVAYKEKRGNFKSIFLLNIFTGWTLIGWVISLVWAFKEQ